MLASARWFAGAVCAALVLGACDGDNSGTAEVTDSGEPASTADAGADAAPPVEPCEPDTSAPVPADRCATEAADTTLPSCYEWHKVELPGTQCSNGSQYKFFVNYSPNSNNLVIMFEGGGACWDYESCAGAARGAVNAEGIEDAHMERTQYMNLLRRTSDNPLSDWNMIFVAYCTGDVHSGSKVADYVGPNGETLTYRHVGHDNTAAIIEWAKPRFTDIPKLLVTGYSAGGIGGLQNYHYIRKGLPGAQCGYLLNDSGPAFHSDGASRQVQDATREAWGADALLDQLDGELPADIGALKADVGLINTVIADKYPRDRLSMTVYEMDLNYSMYSYERFFPDWDEARIHEEWSKELDKVLETFTERKNLAYFVPYFRSDNCSHCVSIPPIDHDVTVILSTPWLGTEIESEQMNLRDFVELLLDDTRPLQSHREGPQPGEQFTPEQAMKCMTPT
jgi:hypothetical protein